MTTAEEIRPDDLVRHAFRQASLPVQDLQVRAYPDEVVVIVYVDEHDFTDAARLGNEVDEQLRVAGITGFVTVRRAETSRTPDRGPVTAGVHDPRATQLARLLTSRSRTSDIQPSLSYVRDSATNIAAVTAPRHQLIFGRRGVGKTALLVEAKRIATDDGDLSAWVNIQTYRREPPERVFLYVAQVIVETLQVAFTDKLATSQVSASTAELADDISRLLSRENVDHHEAERLIPISTRAPPRS